MLVALLSVRTFVFASCLALGCEKAAGTSAQDESHRAASRRAVLLPPEFETKLPRLAILWATRVTHLPQGWIVEGVARGLTVGGARDFYVSGAKERGFVLASQSDLGNTLALHFEKGGERASVTLTKIASQRMLRIRLTYVRAP